MRYVGVALVGSVMVAAVLFPIRARRLAGLAVAALVGLMPVAAWLGFLRISAGTVAARELNYHPRCVRSKNPCHRDSGMVRSVRRANCRQGLSRWLCDCRMRLNRCPAIWDQRNFPQVGCNHGGHADRGDRIRVCALHVTVVLVSITLFDTQTTPNTRIIHPAFVALVVSFLAVAARLCGRPQTGGVTFGRWPSY